MEISSPPKVFPGIFLTIQGNVHDSEIILGVHQLLCICIHIVFLPVTYVILDRIMYTMEIASVCKKKTRQKLFHLICHFSVIQIH